MKQGLKDSWRNAMCLSLLFGAVAAVGWVEWTGYAAFDSTRDAALSSGRGANILCRIDPTCRQLTDSERAMAREFYGDHVDYQRIKVFDRRYLGFIGKGRMMTPNGNIYNDMKTGPVSDFTTDPALIRDFIHEIGHVWQAQNGNNVRGQAATAYIQSGFDYKKAYRYKITDHPLLLDYNLEQQASIFENDYISRRRFAKLTAGKDMNQPRRYGSDFYSNTQALCQKMLAYEEKISQVLPTLPQEGCRAFHRSPPAIRVSFDLSRRPMACLAPVDRKKFDFSPSFRV